MSVWYFVCVFTAGVCVCVNKYSCCCLTVLCGMLKVGVNGPRASAFCDLGVLPVSVCDPIRVLGTKVCMSRVDSEWTSLSSLFLRVFLMASLSLQCVLVGVFCWSRCVCDIFI
jgi:hypothetical protein